MAFTTITFLYLLFWAMPEPNRSADFPDDLAHWYVTVPPRENSDEMLVARSDVEYEWVVVPGKNGPHVHIRHQRHKTPSSLPFKIKSGPNRDGLAGHRITKKVVDGWIIGFEAGEFGGALWWYSPSGKRRYKISDDHIITFLEVKSQIIAICGLEHGTTSEGKAILLSRNETSHWFAETLLEFEKAPYVAIKDGDETILVVTSKQLLNVNLVSKKTDVLLDKSFWSGLYPNSMVVTSSGTVFIGMRHGVAKIERKDDGTYKSSWLLPTKEFEAKRFVEGLR